MGTMRSAKSMSVSTGLSIKHDENERRKGRDEIFDSDGLSEKTLEVVMEKEEDGEMVDENDDQALVHLLAHYHPLLLRTRRVTDGIDGGSLSGCDTDKGFDISSSDGVYKGTLVVCPDPVLVITLNTNNTSTSTGSLNMSSSTASSSSSSSSSSTTAGRSILSLRRNIDTLGLKVDIGPVAESIAGAGAGAVAVNHPMSTFMSPDKNSIRAGSLNASEQGLGQGSGLGPGPGLDQDSSSHSTSSTTTQPGRGMSPSPCPNAVKSPRVVRSNRPHHGVSFEELIGDLTAGDPPSAVEIHIPSQKFESMVVVI